MTDRGLIKSYHRIEKNDREEVVKKERFILGWDNKEAIVAAQKTAKFTESQAQNWNQQIRQSKKQRAELQTRRDTLTRLLNFENFTEIDWKTTTKVVLDLKSQKDILSKSSNQLQTLQLQLETVKQDMGGKDRDRERYLNEKSRLESRVEGYIEQIKISEEFLAAAKNPTTNWSAYRPKIEPLFEGKEPQINNISVLETKVVKNIADAKERKQKDVANLERRLTLDMQRFINPNMDILGKYPNWSADVLNLKADISSLSFL